MGQECDARGNVAPVASSHFSPPYPPCVRRATLGGASHRHTRRTNPLSATVRRSLSSLGSRGSGTGSGTTPIAIATASTPLGTGYGRGCPRGSVREIRQNLGISNVTQSTGGVRRW